MNYRHEWKHEISALDALILRQRLSAVMKPDRHSVGKKYHIRSVYFDTPNDKALREKTDGVDKREKFRIRFYNGDTSYIRIEKKMKLQGLCSKYKCRISEEEAQRIANGDYGWMLQSDKALCRELYVKLKTQQLRPKTIVDYDREAFVFPAGNVRVTIDSEIRTGEFRTDFLNPDTITVPAGDAPIILEVKWDEFLPNIIRDIVFIPGLRSTAFSKYAQCRVFG